MRGAAGGAGAINARLRGCVPPLQASFQNWRPHRTSSLEDVPQNAAGTAESELSAQQASNTEGSTLSDKVCQCLMAGKEGAWFPHERMQCYRYQRGPKTPFMHSTHSISAELLSQDNGYLALRYIAACFTCM
jgi:hypothetical protein